MLHLVFPCLFELIRKKCRHYGPKWQDLRYWSDIEESTISIVRFYVYDEIDQLLISFVLSLLFIQEQRVG